MESIKNLREKIELLEKERSSLLVRTESLKEKGEAKAVELENEVSGLRKDVKALAKLLDVKEKSSK